MGDKLYSRRKIGAWPWIEFTAVELARRLGGKVYDPQSGSLYEELTAEHDQRSLRALHEEDLKTWPPTLVSHYWASLSLEADDRRRLEHIVKQCCACAAEVLKINQEPSLRSEQVDWWHTFNASPELKISASTSRDAVGPYWRRASFAARSSLCRRRGRALGFNVPPSRRV